MKKYVIAIFCLWLIILFPAYSSASVSVPYKTETNTADGNVIETQTAYVPIGIFAKESEIINPEDIYIDLDNHIYIADTGTQKVLKFDQEGNILQEYGEGLLQQPLGVFSDTNQNVYVADYGKEMVYKFSESGELVHEYAKPDSPLFGASSPYKPKKVAIDQRENIYIIGEGATNGIIQLSQDGTFLGYYGANTLEPTFGGAMQNFIATQRQRANLFLKEPPAATNISIDEQGLVYTVTSGTEWEAVRKLNIAGGNILPSNMSEEPNLVDLAIGTIGNIYTLGSDGVIYEYDSSGNLLFSFGGNTNDTNRLGLTTDPTGIDADNNGRLYVTDKERGVIQVFEPTEFTTTLHQGLALFEEGFYVESEEYWNEILRLNSSFGLAHSAMGEALYKQQLYDQSLHEFELANDKDGFSMAFWEVRYQWMEDNLAGVMLIIIALFFIRFVIKILDKKKQILNPLRKVRTTLNEFKLLREIFYITNFIKHPIDSLYYLKAYEKVSILSSAVLYVVLIIEYVLMIYWTGFLFTNRSLEEVHLLFEIGKVLLPILLFVVMNYLVSTITDGEGRFRDVFNGTIYSLAPFLLFILPVTLISNILTYNEAFVYNLAILIIIAWCIVLLFITIKEIHDYTFWGTVRNILITLFGMFLTVLVFFVLYVLFDQLFDFISAILQEVTLRA